MSKLYKGTKNAVSFVGGLKEVPTIYDTNNGEGRVATIDVVTLRPMKDDKAGYVDYTEWHRVVIKDHHAEFIEKYGKPGMQLIIEGWQRTRKVEEAGKPVRYITETVADELQAIHHRSPKKEQTDKHAA